MKRKVVDSNKWFNAAGSLFAACMLFMNMEKPDFTPVSSVKLLNYILECLRNMSNTFDDVFVQVTIVCVAFVAVSQKIGSMKVERLKFSRIFSLFIAIMWTFGKSFNMTNDLHLLVSSPGQLVKTIMFGWGSYYIFYNLLHLFYYFLEKRLDFVPKDIKLKSGKGIRLTKVFDLWERRPFAFPFVFLLIVWLPYVILSYPGNMGYDSYSEISQYLGMIKFTSHHPPFYTVIIGSFVKFGRDIFHSANIGLYMFVFFQYLIFGAVMAYTLSVMKKIKTPLWLQVLTVFIYGFMPHFSAYTTSIIKDIPYSIAFVALMTQIILIFVQKNQFWTVKNVIITVVSMTCVLLLRNNGSYVIIPCVLVLIVKYAIDFRRNTVSTKRLIQVISVLILPIILANAESAFINKKYNISPGSIREALSIPFQQTARYVRDYGDEVTSDEKEAIAQILDYDNIAILYDETISDPVKNTFNDNSTTADLVNYFKVWAIQFTKHPVCYFEATLNQNYYIFYPFCETLNMYKSTTGLLDTVFLSSKETFAPIGITEFTPFSKYQSIFVNIFRITSRLPFLGMLCSVSFYTLVLLCIFVYALNKKNYNILIVSIPLIITLLVIIASPVILTHPRYAFPIAYAIPLVVSYYFHENSKFKTTENSALKHGQNNKIKKKS